MSTALAIKHELRQELPAIFRRIRASAKVIAFELGTTPRSVESHRQAEQLPSLAVGLAYAREFPEVKELFLRLMQAQTGDSDENPAAVLNEISKLLQARGK